MHENAPEKVLEGLAAHGRLVEGADPQMLARTLFSLLLSLAVRDTCVSCSTCSEADPIEDVQEFVRYCVTH